MGSLVTAKYDTSQSQIIDPNEHKPYARHAQEHATLGENVASVVVSATSHASFEAAFDEAKYRSISGPTELTVQGIIPASMCLAGTEPTVDIDCSNLRLVGAAPIACSVLSTVSATPITGGFSVVLQLASAAGISVDNVLCLDSASGGVNPQVLTGSFLITTVTLATNRITISLFGALAPSGATAVDGNVLTSVIKTAQYAQLMYISNRLGLLKNIAFTAQTAPMGVHGLQLTANGSVVLGGIVAFVGIDGILESKGALTAELAGAAVYAGTIANGAAGSTTTASIIGAKGILDIDTFAANSLPGIYVDTGGVCLIRARFETDGATIAAIQSYLGANVILTGDLGIAISNSVIGFDAALNSRITLNAAPVLVNVATDYSITVNTLSADGSFIAA